MNSDLTSQIYMLMGLTQMGSNSANGEFSYLKTFVPIMIVFGPLIMRIFNLIYAWVEEIIYSEPIDKIVSIKFPVHEINVQKNLINQIL